MKVENSLVHATCANSCLLADLGQALSFEVLSFIENMPIALACIYILDLRTNYAREASECPCVKPSFANVSPVR